MGYRFVKVPTGEVGYITLERSVRGFRGRPSRNTIDVCYRSLETGCYRTRTFDTEDKNISFVTKKEFIEFLNSDECIAAFKRMQSRYSHPQNVKRDDEIRSLRLSGRTYASIAKEYGLTPQRIHDICTKTAQFNN